MNWNDNATMNLDACLKCSSCAAECPVAKANPKFGGPKWLGPDAERFRLENGGLLKLALDDCSNCKTCEVTCPSGVKITEFILAARQKENAGPGASAGKTRMRLRGYVLGRAEYMGRMGSVWPGLTNAVLGLKVARYGMDKLLGLGRTAPFPSYGRPLGTRSETNHASNREKSERRVVYFPGCYTSYNDAETGRLVIKILEHVGYRVIVPNFHCCGLPLVANGQFAKAEANRIYNLKAMNEYLQAGVPVITSCTSCGLTLKEEYPKEPGPGAEKIGQQTFDLFEFLWSLYEKNELPLDFQTQEVSLGYHLPCHLRAQGIGIPSLRVLSLIPGVKVHNLDMGCCGLSGSYGFKKEKYEISMQVGAKLFAAAKLGAERGDFKKIVTECGICQVQIEHGSGVPAGHPVEVLAKAYGLT